MIDGLHGPEIVQRTCAACTGAGRLCPECDEELQRQPVEQGKEFQGGAESAFTPTVLPPLEANIRSMRGRGEPLTASQRGFFEPRFGMDFSAVLVHSGPFAGELARSAQRPRVYSWKRNRVWPSGVQSRVIRGY